MIKESPVSVLVILPNNLGDVIMATPVLEGLKKKYPHSKVSFLCEQGFEGGLANNPFCDQIISFPRKIIRDLLHKNWLAGKDRLKFAIKDIADKQFDTIINLSQQNHIALIATLLKGQVLLGQHFLPEGNYCIGDTWSQYLYAIPFSRKCNNLHATDVYRRIAGVKTHRGGYTVAVSYHDKEWAMHQLAKSNIDVANKIMAFQPGAAFASKKWPVSHFVKLGSMLVQDGWQIIVTGSSDEKPIADDIALQIGSQAVSFAGLTTFKQSLSLVSLCNGCVTGDTAHMHAAAACNVRTYALFGPTNPVETGPYGNGHFVFSGSCSSMPCFKTKCDSLDCLKTITPEIVYSCIKNDKIPQKCTCNAYRTVLKENSDYELTTANSSMHSYFDQSSVCLIHSIFDDRWNCVPDRSDYAHRIAEAGRWIEIVSDMCNALMRYEKTRDPNQITMFEVCKNSLANFPTIGAFCTALLNLRLNSIPLLNPLEGVQKSLEVCWQTHKQLGKAIS